MNETINETNCNCPERWCEHTKKCSCKICQTHWTKQENTSDGYHTFKELYEHRITLFIALCKILRADPQYQTGQKADIWRSKLHSDGTSFDGWFVMGIGTNKGEQITYHLPTSKWEETNFAETKEKAPEWDGHTSEDVLKRLKNL